MDIDGIALGLEMDAQIFLGIGDGPLHIGLERAVYNSNSRRGHEILLAQIPTPIGRRIALASGQGRPLHTFRMACQRPGLIRARPLSASFTLRRYTGCSVMMISSVGLT